MIQHQSNEPVITRGLEGIVAAETDISFVDGVNGDLYYKGYNIHDIADTCTYMEVAYLLLNGNLPTVTQLDEFRRLTVTEMRIPTQVVKMMEIMPPSSHPMDVLRTMVSSLSCFDHDATDNSLAANRRKAIRLVAQIPTIVAHLYMHGFIQFEMGYASAIAVVLFIMTYVLGQLSMRLFSERS